MTVGDEDDAGAEEGAELPELVAWCVAFARCGFFLWCTTFFLWCTATTAFLCGLVDCFLAVAVVFWATGAFELEPQPAMATARMPALMSALLAWETIAGRRSSTDS